MDEKQTSRLEAFSDGVFAVAITLLVLNIKVPGIDSPGQALSLSKLGPALLNEWPMLAAYVTSFFTIGVMWLNHHRLFTHIKRLDTVLISLNLLLLLVIVFVPVPTALLAEYITHPDENLAAIIYSGTFLLAACCFNVLWRYASYHHRLLGKNADATAVEAISRQYLFGPLVYLATFGIAWISPPVSIALTFVLALFFMLPSHIVRPFSAKKALVETAEAVDE